MKKSEHVDLSSDVANVTLEIDKAEKTKNNIVAIGCDIGTMNIVCARSDSDEVKIMRNVFLPLKEDEVDISELSDINYAKSEEGDLFIIGDDAFRLSNIFGKKVSRPMENGLISPKEISSIDVLTIMLKTLIGDVKNKDSYCSFSCPAEAIDEGRSVIYHEKVFSKILATLGVNYKSINEAMAIIYSECAKESYSGIAISFGAGMANVVCAYKGIEAVKFSTARSGDWIDKNVAESLNMVQNRVTSIKEKNLNLSEVSSSDNKKIKRVLEALHYYYEALMNYTIKKMINEFQNNLNVEIDEPIPIILSGGTSIPEGFIEMFKDIISKSDITFEISEIRRAKNPMTAVANGLLVRTMSDINAKKI